MPTPSLLIVPARFKTGRLYSQIPTANGDFTVTRNTTARRFNSAGLLESVASGIPRLDYYTSGGTAGCPALLVEPSAQNQCQRSEEFNNAFHFPNNLNAFGSGSVANTNATQDPYGTNVADYIQEDSAASAQHSIIDIFAGNVSGTTYTWSVFAKAAERTIIQLANNAGGGGVANFNLTTGVATLTNGVSCSMQNYGNGWWRCVLTYISNVTGNHNVQIRLCDASGNSSYNGTGNQGAYIFGAQLEVGSVPTSYIPTTTAAVTRSADVISVSGAVSGAIGQTAGTIYCEFTFLGTPTARSGPIYLRQASLKGLSINFAPTDSPSAIKFTSRNTAGTSPLTIVSGALQFGTFYKVAVAYDAAGTAAGGIQASGVVAYVNGSQVNIGTFQVPDAAGLTEFRMYGANSGDDTEAFNGRIRAAALYTTRLTNAELATLTTP